MGNGSCSGTSVERAADLGSRLLDFPSLLHGRLSRPAVLNLGCTLESPGNLFKILISGPHPLEIVSLLCVWEEAPPNQLSHRPEPNVLFISFSDSSSAAELVWFFLVKYSFCSLILFLTSPELPPSFLKC